MTDETTPAEQVLPVHEAPKPDVAEQIAGFEQRVTQRLDDLTGEIRAMRQEVIEPLAAAEAGLTLPEALPEAAQGEAPGFLGGIAHKVADMAKTAVGCPRSDEVDEFGNPDGGITPAEAAALNPPVGPHVRAVEEARANTAAGVSVAA